MLLLASRPVTLSDGAASPGASHWSMKEKGSGEDEKESRPLRFLCRPYHVGLAAREAARLRIRGWHITRSNKSGVPSERRKE